MEINNKNLESLFRHATMVNRSKYGVYWSNYISYSICSKINSKTTVHIYKPIINSTLIKKSDVVHDNLYNDLLISNIRSLTNHYIKYFNLPIPKNIAINSGYVFRCIPYPSDELYQIIGMFRLLRYKKVCSSYTIHAL